MQLLAPEELWFEALFCFAEVVLLEALFEDLFCAVLPALLLVLLADLFSMCFSPPVPLVSAGAAKAIQCNLKNDLQKRG